MNRRHFLVGAASGVAAMTGMVGAQAPAPAAGQAPAAPARGGGGGGRGRGGPPAVATPAKLARIAIMTLNYSNIIKRPWNEATPERTLNILDLPQFYVDTYGVRNIEFQANDLHQTPNTQADIDVAYWRELRAKIDAAGCKANQINIEIGTMAFFNQATCKAEALSGEPRALWLARGKKWVDAAGILGVTRLMHNQGNLNDDSKAGVISLWKELNDYARPKGITISGETRGSGPTGPGGGGGGGARGRAGAAPGGAPAAPAAPATPPPAPCPALPQISAQERLRHVYGILVEATNAANATTNLDFGGDTRFHSQQELHDAIRAMLPRSAGSMHTRVSPTWDLGTAIRYAESIGYRGLYTIEVNDDAAVRIVYNAVIANLP
jgi:hypothetical protein